MLQPHLHVQFLLAFLACTLLLLTAPFVNAQDKENETVSPDLPQSTFTPSTPSRGNNTGSFCVAGYNDCSTIGHRDACCTLTEVCTLDDAGRVGCCEFGVKCVGEIPLKNGAGTTCGGKSFGLGGVMALAAIVVMLVSGAEIFGSVVTI